MTAVGLVLLSAAVVGTTKARELILFTGYSRPFISAIMVNMQNNKLWIDGLYDCSEWLSSDGTIDKARFWDHIEIACGSLWLPVGDTYVSARPLHGLLGRTTPSWQQKEVIKTGRTIACPQRSQS